jgi:hypothetical protein
MGASYSAPIVLTEQSADDFFKEDAPNAPIKIDDEEKPEIVYLVDVFEDNWEAALIFQLCNQEMISGMGGVFWRNFSAQEIESAANMLGIKDEEKRQSLIFDVRYMGNIAAEYLNTKKGK